MQGIRGAKRHWPQLVIEFDLDMSKDPKTEKELDISMKHELNVFFC